MGGMTDKMVRRTSREYIRGVSPYERKGKEKKVKDRNESVCLNCDKEECKRGYCEKMKR